MMSPIEVRNQEFGRGIRGYKVQEVDAFMRKLAEDYEKLYQECMELKETVQRQEFELARYRKLESSVNETLLLAQKTAEEVKQEAQKEAELLVKTAKLKVSEMISAYAEVLKRLELFRAELKSLLNVHHEVLAGSEEKIEQIKAFFAAKDVEELVDILREGQPGK